MSWLWKKCLYAKSGSLDYDLKRKKRKFSVSQISYFLNWLQNWRQVTRNRKIVITLHKVNHVTIMNKEVIKYRTKWINKYIGYLVYLIFFYFLTIYEAISWDSMQHVPNTSKKQPILTNENTKFLKIWGSSTADLTQTNPIHEKKPLSFILLFFLLLLILKWDYKETVLKL